MKVALVHDWLNTRWGGAEQVIIALAETYPEAPIYTLLYDRERFRSVIAPESIKPSYLQQLPQIIRQHPRSLLPLIPGAIERFDLRGYDVILSSSGAYSKNIIPPSGSLHISYCHTPMRFVWDYYPQYLEELGLDPLRRWLVRTYIPRLRQWDFHGTSRVDAFIANSHNVQARIKKYYRRDSMIIYPPVQLPPHRKVPKKDFYITISALTEYKKLDLLIEAFAINGYPLVIVGDGPQRATLESQAPDNIRFTGFIPDIEKWKLLARARGFVFTHEEDFGIAPVEAMAAATPVIAYARGGVLETVVNKQTGILFHEQSAKAVNEAIMQARKQRFNSSILRKQAERFDEKLFKAKVKQTVEQLYETHHKH